jgi:hypothetical protein
MRTGLLIGLVAGVVVSLAGVAAAHHIFSDVPDDHPHADGIHWAAERGLIQGHPDGTFRPADPLTRGQIATMLQRQGAYPGPVYTLTPVCGSTALEAREHNHRGSGAATVEYAVEGGPRVQLFDPIPDDAMPLVFDPGQPGMISLFVDGIARGIARTAESC